MDNILSKYFDRLSSEQISKFEQLGTLYAEWNEKINVISRKDIDHLYERHILHSLAIFKFAPFQKGSKILDIGTGGGFPGIPLAIMMPEVEFVLVDSIGKKINVVNEVSTALGLTNITAHHARAESIKGKFDFVVSRAVADLSLLVQWSQGKISTTHKNAIPNGLICLKGGDLKEEMKPFKKTIEVYDLSSWFREEFFETKKLVYVTFD
jgi:16S rRNA (guanine527-N7)-methyltransferase